MLVSHLSSIFFFFNDTATTEIYTLSLHDALPISSRREGRLEAAPVRGLEPLEGAIDQPGEALFLGAAIEEVTGQDRKSTRLNSSHGYISYAVFCLKKKKKNKTNQERELPTNCVRI